jgi:hypothetical protein
MYRVLNSSLDLAVVDALAVVHEGKLKGCTNNANLHLVPYFPVIFSICSTKFFQRGDVNESWLNSITVLDIICFPIRWAVGFACVDRLRKGTVFRVVFVTHGFASFNGSVFVLRDSIALMRL